MIDILISISEKEFPFFMSLVEKFDFVTVKEPSKQGSSVERQKDFTITPLSPAIEGLRMENLEFENWTQGAESMPSITLKEAKNKWEKKRKELQEFTK